MPLSADRNHSSGKVRRHIRQRSIEPLEGRLLFALFANGIDSDNLGEGVWAWGLQSAMSRLGYKSGSVYDYAGFFSYVHNTQGCQYLIMRAANGGTIEQYTPGSQSYTSAVRTAAHNAGLKLLPYFYIRGTDDATVTAEINAFNTIVDSVGADGVIFDIEGDWAAGVGGATSNTRITNYMNGIHKSQNGDGVAIPGVNTATNDSLFMAYSSFPYVSLHGEIPWLKLGDYCDATMPQPYWYTLGSSPSSLSCRSPTKGQTLRGPGGQQRMVVDTDSEYRMMSLEASPRANLWNGHSESIKPVIMTGQMYTTAMPASEIVEFYNAVKDDTNAVGSGNVAGYRYKNINFFDENTAGVTTVAQRDALNSLSIGDLPGTPASPSPGNAAVLASSPTLLNWADVVNTYGAGSVGAATSYSVFVDGVLKTTVDARTSPSEYVPAVLSTGAHNWQIKANNIFGTTNGPVWTFTVSPPFNAPSGLQVNSFSNSSVSLSWTDNTSSETQFLIERKIGPSGSYSLVGTVAANIISFTDTAANGVLPGTNYYYHVRAFDGASTFSLYSNDAILTTLANTPIGLAASDGQFQAHVALSWSAAAGASKYRIYRNSVNDPNTASVVSEPTGTSFNDSPPTSDTTYYYWIASLNSANAASPKSTGDSGFNDTISPSASNPAFQSQANPLFLSFEFSEPVGASVGIGDVSITNLDSPGGATPIVSSYQYIGASNVVKFFLDNTLPDGNFQATISGITDAAGNIVSGSTSQTFYFLRGDASGDRAVNALDFGALASHWGDVGAGFSGGDFNFDGTVNGLDFTALAARFNTTLPDPAPAPALAAATAPNLFGSVAVKEQGLFDPPGDALPA